jgi:membrane-associated phospholipid phosphatase
MWSEAAELRSRLVGIACASVVLVLATLVALGEWGDMAAVRALSRSAWVTDHLRLVRAVSDWGMYPFYGLFLAALGYTARRRLPWTRAVALGWLWAELLGAGLTVQVLKTLCGRARPDQAWTTGGLDQWVGPTLRAAYHSFPSGHTADLFVSAAFTVLLLRPRWAGLVAAPVAVTVALSRVALAKHYPSDVLSGILLAAAATFIVGYRLLRTFDAGQRQQGECRPLAQDSTR